MKKDSSIWIIFVLVVLSIITDIFAIIGFTVISILGTLQIVTLVFFILDAVISLIYLYKLFIFKRDIVLWTDIIFGFTSLEVIYSIVIKIINNSEYVLFTTVELIIIIAIWILFRKHLKKIMNIA